MGIIAVTIGLDGIGYEDHHIERRHVASAHGVTVDNLRDAGCSEELIEQYASAASGCARICLLKQYRRELLDIIHAEQKKLECLDYLIYQLRSVSTGCCSRASKE